MTKDQQVALDQLTLAVASILSLPTEDVESLIEHVESSHEAEDLVNTGVLDALEVLADLCA